MTQPEARLQRSIQDALRANGAFVFKVHGSKHMMVGLPDLIVCYHGFFIAMEIKMPGNSPSDVQKLRIRQIRESGGIAYVVRSVPSALTILKRVDALIEGSSSCALHTECSAEE